MYRVILFKTSGDVASTTSEFFSQFSKVLLNVFNVGVCRWGDVGVFSCFLSPINTLDSTAKGHKKTFKRSTVVRHRPLILVAIETTDGFEGLLIGVNLSGPLDVGVQRL